MRNLSFEFRQELGTGIAGEIEPEVEGSLQGAQADGIQPVRIPLARKEGGSVCATQTPCGQCFTPAVGARPYRSFERVGRSPPESSAARSKIPGVLSHACKRNRAPKNRAECCHPVVRGESHPLSALDN